MSTMELVQMNSKKMATMCSERIRRRKPQPQVRRLVRAPNLAPDRSQPLPLLRLLRTTTSDDEIPVRAARSQPPSSPLAPSKPSSPSKGNSSRKRTHPDDSADEDEQDDRSSPDVATKSPVKPRQTYEKPASRASQMSMGDYQSKRKRIRR
jgi:hypothetical protein